MIDPQPDLQLTMAQADRLLAAWLAGPVSCSDIAPLEGGMVNSVFQLEFDCPPHRAVVKLHSSEGHTFGREARALHYLRAGTTCPVPEVYVLDTSECLIPYAYLLLEHVPGVCLKSLDLNPAARADIDAQLALVLAGLHDHTGTGWGAIDSEERTTTWAALFVSRLAEVRADPRVAQRLGPDVLADVDRAIAVAKPSLRESGEPTLVFGDVWDGNLIVDPQGDGRIVLTGLLDPDLQFADVEYELAYLEVFDVSREAFFAAYTDHHPLRSGYEHRRLFYWLHTALVHVALFGDEFFCQFTARIASQIAEGQRS